MKGAFARYCVMGARASQALRNLNEEADTPTSTLVVGNRRMASPHAAAAAAAAAAASAARSGSGVTSVSNHGDSDVVLVQGIIVT
ncbi:hypothetical protein BO86DRAFT_401041 [Aspergillus japonicus CBS 114.51]|uniref:Uncharacterized protein n=2 Tax=Aspergillus TaxID=5052 RepID=A0A2V5HHL2_ASPV1|nr:hypothetical protein BO86DRAFT_401041 [Aspergillus japonicus CBS 114.51]PYI23281.1 hypothetical protein BO99DRAFT_428998 [Aspergillus violaceofuscus CBS 115571]RAH80268.1 hypothetical protein BO86DRAFT_401041 [Aspergillus japonicus CBS 114.51]